MGANRQDRILMGAAAVALAATLAFPPTRGLMRDHVVGLLPLNGPHPALTPAAAPSGAALRAAARTMPGDPEAACAAAFTYMDPRDGPLNDPDTANEILTAVRSAEARFPRNPVVAACIVRALSFGVGPDTDPGPLLDAAARGERVDPGNALFPFTQSTALFRAGRPAEGIAALKRAAGCPRWADYMDRVADGYARLVVSTGAAPGVRPLPTGIGTARSSGGWAAFRFGMRDGARGAVDAAAALEAAGRIDEGIAVRHALMRVGERARVQSSTAMGSLQGASMVWRAARRLGGAPDTRRREPVGDLRARYIDWLDRVGHPEEVAYADEQFMRAMRVREIVREGEARLDPSRLTAGITLWWAGTQAVLGVALFALLAGAFTGLMGLGLRPAIAAAPGSAYFAVVGAGLWRAGRMEAAVLLAFAAALPFVMEKAAASPDSALPRFDRRLVARVCCGCMVLYAVLAPLVIQAQRRASDTAAEISHHEGRFYAGLVNTAWPE